MTRRDRRFLGRTYQAAILLRSEAVSSSQIEGISAGARAIAEAEVNGSGSQNADLVVANTLAMLDALGTPSGVSAERILTMHDVLMHRSNAQIAGTFRNDQVWIGRDRIPHTADFVPPAAHRVPASIDDLVAFLDRDDLPVLVQTAVGHAHFESIHPFPDGNGRTGRALMHACLVGQGLIRNSALPVSAGLLIRRTQYIEALTQYRDGNPDPIVSELSRAVLVAAAEGRRLAQDSQQVRDRWREALAGIRSDSAVHRLADGLIARPVVNIRGVAEILGTGINLRRHLDVLVDRGVLQQTRNTRTRHTTWRAQDVLDVLDEYSSRIGRRVRG